MLTAVQNFIPVMSSEAGLCLTAENWQEAKVTALSYSLEVLLQKPGFEVLKKITNISVYLGWSKTLVLNAMTLTANREGIYHLKSPYDGSKMKLSASELIELVLHLKPEAVILPRNILKDCPNIWNTWPESITAFLHVDDLQLAELTQAHGVYFNNFDESKLAELELWKHLPCYVSGTISIELIQHLHSKEIEFIETDEPARLAMQGQVYNQAGMVDLTHSDTEMNFEVIDPNCTCTTCSAKLTQAYFHHLLQHTPLLCQRFLIQHNVYWIENN